MLQVLLENCHLASSWMPTLARVVHGLQTNSSLHTDFRLWLTSLPTPAFPATVLQQGLKVTCEPPRSFAASMQVSLDTLPADTAAAVSGMSREGRCLLYATTAFHAAVQERRKFGALGWNVPYAFASSDLTCALHTLQNLIANDGPTPWRALRYVVGEIVYGGRVTDDNDRTLLMALLDKYVSPQALDTKASQGGHLLVPMPSCNVDTLDGLRNLAGQLPASDAPHLFGLGQNADTAFKLKVSLPRS